MEPVDVIEGDVSVLDRADVDTDQIIPKQFLKRVERTGFGEFLFYDWLRDGEIELEPNPILVAGPNFGCGSSREHAAWALEDYGFKAVIAPSFADIFFVNSTKIGLLPVVLPREHCRGIAEAGRARIDLDDQTVDYAGGVIRFEIEEEIKHRLLNGLDDIAITLDGGDAIDAYEAATRRSGGRRPRSDDGLMSGSRDWDAATYDRVSGPQVDWARGVIERLGLQGDEIVLDAGCGSGRVTAMLLARPRGRRLGDRDRRLGGDGRGGARAPRGTNTSFLTPTCSSSSSTRRSTPSSPTRSSTGSPTTSGSSRVLHAALRPGGRFEAQCGGAGNVARFYAAAAEVVRARALPRARGRVRPDQLRRPRGDRGADARRRVRGRPLLAPRLAGATAGAARVRADRLSRVPRRAAAGGARGALPGRGGRATGPEPELDYVRLNISAKKAERAES